MEYEEAFYQYRQQCFYASHSQRFRRGRWRPCCRITHHAVPEVKNFLVSVALHIRGYKHWNEFQWWYNGYSSVLWLNILLWFWVLKSCIISLRQVKYAWSVTSSRWWTIIPVSIACFVWYLLAEVQFCWISIISEYLKRRRPRVFVLTPASSRNCSTLSSASEFLICSHYPISRSRDIWTWRRPNATNDPCIIPEKVVSVLKGICNILRGVDILSSRRRSSCIP